MMPNHHPGKPTIAVAIPCYQEALTVGKVVTDFQRELPDARIYVYDNNCTDGTAEAAAASGATVRREKRQGKGFVVAAIFEQLSEDIIVMVDGCVRSIRSVSVLILAGGTWWRAPAIAHPPGDPQMVQKWGKSRAAGRL